MFLYTELNVKTVLFQTIQFSVVVSMSNSVLFQAIQFSTVDSISNTVLFQAIQFSTVDSISNTVLFQAIQFSISTPFNFISPIDRALSGITIPGQSGHGNDGNEGYTAFPKAPALLETHQQIA